MKIFWRQILAVVLGSGLFIAWGIAYSAPDDTSVNNTFTTYLPYMSNNWADSYSYFGAHTSGFEDDHLNNMRKAHLNFIRVSKIYWNRIEPVRTDPPTYHWEAVDHNQLIRVRATNANLIVMVLKAPNWALKYPGIPCGPIKPSAYDEYAEFMAALVARYSQPPYDIKLWQIGNEPEVDHEKAPEDFGYGCWGEANDPYFGGRAYGNMLNVIKPAMKAADPEAQVIIGGLLLGCSPDVVVPCEPSRFIDGILESQGSNSFDGVAFHAYDFYGLELGLYGNSDWDSYSFSTGPVLIEKVAFLRERLAAYGREDKYLIGTETSLLCGSDVGDEPECQTNDFLHTQAIYLVHSYTAGLAEGLLINNWYSLTVRWRNANLVNQDNSPKPAFNALKFVQSRLGDVTYTGEISRDDVGVQGIAGYKFEREGRGIWVVWTNETQFINITLPTEPMIVFDVYGRQISFENRTVRVNVMPLIVEFQPVP